MTLCEMAQEYRTNAALLELRLRLLQRAGRRARQREVRFRLKRRIRCLQMLINESRRTAFELEHYHGKGGAAYAESEAV